MPFNCPHTTRKKGAGLSRRPFDSAQFCARRLPPLATVVMTKPPAMMVVVVMVMVMAVVIMVALVICRNSRWRERADHER